MTLRPPAAIVHYFGRYVDTVIVQEYPIPQVDGSAGWSASLRRRTSVAWARELVAKGITHISVAPVDDPTLSPADFSLEEIIEQGSWRRAASQPTVIG